MTAITVPFPVKSAKLAAPPGVAAPPTGVPDLFAALLGPALLPPSRQDDAASGKDLPTESDEDAADDAVAPGSVIPLLPLPCDIAALPASKVATPIGDRKIAVATPTLQRIPGEGQGPVAPADVGLPAAADAGGSTQGTIETAPTAGVSPLGLGLRRGGVTEPLALKPSSDRTTEISTPFRPIGDAEPPPTPRFDSTTQPVRPAPTPTADIAAIVAGPRVAPAGAMFAAAIHRAAQADPRDPAPAAPTILALGTDTAPHAVLATTHTQQSALDMNRDTWPQHMIERIETLRDAADAQDTRIRLVPDRLGTIDVAVRRDGDAVQVQFVAAQPETRQLLAEAQPRLAELAEARGLRLSAETADTGGNARHHNHSQPARAAAPVRTISEDDVPVADDRVA